MKHIVVDLEMNPIAKEYRKEKTICSREIIEIGAVVLDEQYKEVDSFRTLVKPQYNDKIKPNLEKLTGITTELVENAPVFEEALEKFFTWCKDINDDIKIYQWSESDWTQVTREIELKEIFIEEQYKKFLYHWIDFQKEYGKKLNLSNAISLKKAVMYAGVEFEGREHDALDDARNTAVLLEILRTPELCKKALDRVIEVLTPSPMNVTLGSMFNFEEFGITV